MQGNCLHKSNSQAAIQQQPCSPAVKEGQRREAGPFVEVCCPAGNSPRQGRRGVTELAPIEEEGRPGADGRVHPVLL